METSCFSSKCDPGGLSQRWSDREMILINTLKFSAPTTLGAKTKFKDSNPKFRTKQEHKHPAGSQGSTGLQRPHIFSGHRTLANFGEPHSRRSPPPMERFPTSGGSFDLRRARDKLFKKPFIFHFNQNKSSLIKKIHCKLLNLHGATSRFNNQVKALMNER